MPITIEIPDHVTRFSMEVKEEGRIYEFQAEMKTSRVKYKSQVQITHIDMQNPISREQILLGMFDALTELS